jgi:hypothetical protein
LSNHAHLEIVMQNVPSIYIRVWDDGSWQFDEYSYPNHMSGDYRTVLVPQSLIDEQDATDSDGIRAALIFTDVLDMAVDGVPSEDIAEFISTEWIGG